MLTLKKKKLIYLYIDIFSDENALGYLNIQNLKAYQVE